MTSTRFNVGLGENTRNSSRVLRPPGGGHTDIFGGESLPQVKKDNGRNASSIMEGTNSNTVPPSPVITPTEPPPNNKTLPEPQKTSSEPATQPQRTRVPPGGFSSGLW